MYKEGSFTPDALHCVALRCVTQRNAFEKIAAFEKTCAATQKNEKKSCFLDFDKTYLKRFKTRRPTCVVSKTT